MRNESFPILGIDHIEMYVGSAKQTAHYLSEIFGFEEVAHAGHDTGNKHKTSHVLAQGDIRIVVSGALTPDSAIAQHVLKHGDGVRDIALRVPSAEEAYRLAVMHGAQPVRFPTVTQDVNGKVVRASIGTYGDTIHTFIERDEYDGPFLPGYMRTKVNSCKSVGLIGIDHIVGNVELGHMEKWVRHYEDIMGFTNIVHFTDSQISSDFTALMSKVMADGSGKIKFPINEPAQGKRESHVDEYLSAYGGAGVQHIALQTTSILKTVSTLRDRGVKFLGVPPAYYVDAAVRFADVPEVDIRALAALGVLMDRDEDGYLLQIFTKHVFDRRTLFFEIIERQGSKGFGLRNFKALFDAMERDKELLGQH